MVFLLLLLKYRNKFDSRVLLHFGIIVKDVWTKTEEQSMLAVLWSLEKSGVCHITTKVIYMWSVGEGVWEGVGGAMKTGGTYHSPLHINSYYWMFKTYIFTPQPIMAMGYCICLSVRLFVCPSTLSIATLLIIMHAREYMSSYLCDI